jgi:hypothetical protein
MKTGFLLIFLLVSVTAWAQHIEVEYQKDRDFSKYRTFSFGESEVITPKDEQTIESSKVHGWVKEAITRELEANGLKRMDSLGDLVVSYIIGSAERSEIESVGPLGGTPGMVAQPRSSLRDFTTESFIIDLKDKSKNLVWRINAETVLTSSAVQSGIDEVVARGFKKYAKAAKGKKRK